MLGVPAGPPHTLSCKSPLPVPPASGLLLPAPVQEYRYRVFYARQCIGVVYLELYLPSPPRPCIYSSSASSSRPSSECALRGVFPIKCHPYPQSYLRQDEPHECLGGVPLGVHETQACVVLHNLAACCHHKYYVIPLPPWPTCSPVWPVTN